MVLFILSGVGSKPAPGNSHHVIQTMKLTTTAVRFADAVPVAILLFVLSNPGVGGGSLSFSR
jgi:hypothetical protein